MLESKLFFRNAGPGDEIAYFTVRWKTRKLVSFTAPKTWNNTVL